MQVIKGKDFNIYIEKNGVPVRVCNATDFVYRSVRDTVEISGPQGQDRDYVAGKKGYTINITGVITYIDGYTYLETAFNAGTKVKWTGRDLLNGGIVHTGTVLFTNIDWASPVRGDFTFDTSAVGCGPKETLRLPISSEVYLADENLQRLFGCPNPYPVSVFWYNADGTAQGNLLGIAYNADDVITLYNNSVLNEYYILTAGHTGCDFNLLANWDAPFIPTVVFAIAAPALGAWTGRDNEGSSPDQINSELSSPGYV
jgi:hypothetical protein